MAKASTPLIILKDADFRKEIKSAPAVGYLLFGEEDYLKNIGVEFARQTLCPDEGMRTFNEIILDALDFTPERLLDALGTLPMFADRKVVVLRGLNFNAMRQGEIDALTATVSGSTKKVRAPKSGLFSSLVDGYESVLTPERLATMTPEEYRNLESEDAAGACKLVYGTKWYFVTLMRASDAKNLTSGGRVLLRFQTGLDRDLTLSVERISEEDGGQCLVVLSSDEGLNLTTLLRHQNAQIIFKQYSGIRVPRSAVRIVWETVTDEDGTPMLNADGSEKQRQVYGVYCMWGSTARFKKVNILWQEDEYMIVESAQADDPYRSLRAGDQVITAAEELYDGKVIE